MSEKEFGEMGVTAFFLKLFFFNKKTENAERVLAELIRNQTYLLINIQLSEKNKYKDPQQMWQLPWDKQTKKVKHLTKEELKEQVLQANKIFSGI